MPLVWKIIVAIMSARQHYAVAFVVRNKFASQTSDPCYNTRHDHRQMSVVRLTTTLARMAIGPNNVKDEKNMTDESIIDEKAASRSVLDKVIFDPDEPSNENNWFANLVKNDYYTAEALYAGVIVIIGVIVAQDMLRIVKDGGGEYHNMFR